MQPEKTYFELFQNQFTGDPNVNRAFLKLLNEPARGLKKVTPENLDKFMAAALAYPTQFRDLTKGSGKSLDRTFYDAAGSPGGFERALQAMKISPTAFQEVTHVLDSQNDARLASQFAGVFSHRNIVPVVTAIHENPVGYQRLKDQLSINSPEDEREEDFVPPGLLRTLSMAAETPTGFQKALAQAQTNDNTFKNIAASDTLALNKMFRDLETQAVPSMSSSSTSAMSTPSTTPGVRPPATSNVQNLLGHPLLQEAGQFSAGDPPSPQRVEKNLSRWERIKNKVEKTFGNPSSGQM